MSVGFFFRLCVQCCFVCTDMPVFILDCLQHCPVEADVCVFISDCIECCHLRTDRGVYISDCAQCYPVTLTYVSCLDFRLCMLPCTQ